MCLTKRLAAAGHVMDGSTYCQPCEDPVCCYIGPCGCGEGDCVDHPLPY